MNKAGVTAKSVHQKWQFSVEIAGIDGAYFTTASFPEVEFEESTFSPAGSAFDQKTAGRATFSDVTLEKGIPQDAVDNAVIDWIKTCMDFKNATGSVPKSYMRDIDLVRYDRNGKQIKRFRLYGAWVKSANFGEGDGSSSDANIEEMTICYQYFDIV